MFARLLWQKADIEEQRCPASTLGELVVKELTPSLRDDFLHFFDKISRSRTILTGLTVTAQHIISQTTGEKPRVGVRPQASSRRIGYTDSSPMMVGSLW